MIPPPLVRSARFDVVGLGEISVDDVLLLERPLVPRGKQAVAARERIGGGQVATAMVAARRLGLSAALLGAVGDDEAGRHALDGLRGEGVDVAAVRTAACGTRTAVITVDERGDRTVLDHHDRRLAPGPLGRAAEGRCLLVDGIYPEAALAAATLARAAGAVVACDLERRSDGTEALLPLLDLCIVSEGFVGDEPRRALPELAARTASGFACVTLGAAGALAWDRGTFVAAPAFTPSRVTDTTACGDTFRAGFLAAFLDGSDLEACLRFANAAAALKCRDLGRRGCPSRAEVDALLAAHAGVGDDRSDDAGPPGARA